MDGGSRIAESDVATLGDDRVTAGCAQGNKVKAFVDKARGFEEHGNPFETTRYQLCHAPESGLHERAGVSIVSREGEGTQLRASVYSTKMPLETGRISSGTEEKIKKRTKGSHPGVRVRTHYPFATAFFLPFEDFSVTVRSSFVASANCLGAAAFR